MRFRLLFLALVIGCLLLFMQLRGGFGRESGQEAIRAPTGAETGSVAPDSELQSGALQRVQEPFRSTREAAAVAEPIIEEEPGDPGVDDDFEETVHNDMEHWSRVPSDPVQTGNSTLELTFLDSVTGHPVSGFVDLWRLGVAGNESWTDGDQKQARLEAKEGKVTVNDLAEGRYRTFVYRARKGSDSAPEFSVEGDLTSVQVQVEMPRPVRVRLHLVDMHGFPFQSPLDPKFEVKKSQSPEYRPDELRPKWLSRRALRDPSVTLPGRTGGASMGSGAKSWTEVEHASGGIDLGEVLGDPRHYFTRHRWKVRIANGKPVSVWMVAFGVGNYVAVLPNPDDILDSIDLPDGVTAADLREEISISIFAVPVDFNKGESIAARWPQIKLRVRIRLTGFERVSVEWKPGQESMPPIKLKRK